MGDIASIASGVAGVAGSLGGSGAASDASGALQAGVAQASAQQQQFAQQAINELNSTYGNASSLLNQYYPIASGQIQQGSIQALQALNNAQNLGSSYLQGGQQLAQAQTMPGVLAGYGALDALSQSVGLGTPQGGSANLYMQNQANVQNYNTQQQNALRQYNQDYLNYLPQQQAWQNQVNQTMAGYNTGSPSPGSSAPSQSGPQGQTAVQLLNSIPQNVQQNINSGSVVGNLSMLNQLGLVSGGLPASFGGNPASAAAGLPGAGGMSGSGGLAPGTNTNTQGGYPIPAGGVQANFTPVTGAQPFQQQYTSADQANQALQQAYQSALGNYNTQSAQAQTDATNFYTKLDGINNNQDYANIAQTDQGAMPGFGPGASLSQEIQGTLDNMMSLQPGGGGWNSNGMIPLAQQFISKYGNLKAPTAPTTIGAAPTAPTMPSMAPPPALTNVPMSTMSGQNALQQFYNTPQAIMDFGQLSATNTPAQNFQSTPGYQFQFDQGVKAQNAAASAGGYLNNPNLQQSLTTFGQGLANTDYYNYLNQLNGAFSNYQNTLSGIASGGLSAAGQQAGIASQTGMAQANLTQGLGTALGSTNLQTGFGLSNLSSNQGTNLANTQMGLGNQVAGTLGSLGTNLSNLSLAGSQANAKGILGAQNANQQGLGSLAGLFKTNNGSSFGGDQLPVPSALSSFGF